MDMLGSKYQQLGLPPAERLTLPEFATDKNEFMKAKKMLQTAIRKQTKKGRKNKRGALLFGPAVALGLFLVMRLVKGKARSFLRGPRCTLRRKD